MGIRAQKFWREACHFRAASLPVRPAPEPALFACCAQRPLNMTLSLALNAFLELTHCSARMFAFSDVRAQDLLPRQGQLHVQGVESATGWFLGAHFHRLVSRVNRRCLLPEGGQFAARMASLLTCTSLPLLLLLPPPN